jgi:hypothetical protein
LTNLLKERKSTSSDPSFNLHSPFTELTYKRRTVKRVGIHHKQA